MKRNSLLIVGLILSIIAALAAPQRAAALTAACTQINNRAYVDYQVGGVSQAQKGSTDGAGNDNTSFYVGVKVDVLVQNSGALVTVTPNSAGTATINALTFTVTNNGNATQKYALTAIPEPDATANPYAGGGTDIFDGTNMKVNGTLGSTGTIANLAPTSSATVTISIDVSAAQVTNDLAVYGLKAQSQWIVSGSTTTKNSTAAGNVIGDTTYNTACNALGATTVDVVAGDGAGSETGDVANDGAYSARSAYKVAGATLTITKTKSVYWDPVNLLVSPKAIPGAVITYTVTIANAAGGASATSVNLVDDLTSELASHLSFGNGETGGGNTSFEDGTIHCRASGAGYGIAVDGVCKTDAYSANNDGASWNDTSDPSGGTTKIAVSGLTLNAGDTKTIKYQVTVQ